MIRNNSHYVIKTRTRPFGQRVQSQFWSDCIRKAPKEILGSNVKQHQEGQRDAFASQEDIEGDLIIGLIAVGNDNSSYYI